MRDGLFTESVERKRKKQGVMKKRKANVEEKKLHSVFFKETKEVRDDKDSWLWLQKGGIKERDRRINTSSTGTGITGKLDQENDR